MKTKLLILLLASISIANAAVTISGTAIRDAGGDDAGITSGDFAVFVLSLDGSTIEASDFSFTAGDDLTAGATYGANFQIIDTTGASAFLGTVSVGTTSALTLGGGVDTNDYFAVLTFGSASTTAAAAGSYSVFTDGDWKLPADSVTVTFGTEIAQLTNVGPNTTGIVVPEPSTYAALAGLCALSFVLVRRRRA
tara:strand:+ start:524 stop:1105 length:582 start_codon:yes stop_codon:yes gene_type:complete